MIPWLLSGLGLFILLLAGDALVRGAVTLSLRIGIPALIVSLTIVAFGTSAPELLIAINAVLDDSSGLALGNVVGSNIANILLVLGFPAIVATLHTSAFDSRKTYIFMLGATFLFIALAYRGYFDYFSGLLLLSTLGLVLYFAVRDGRNHQRNNEKSDYATEGLEKLDPEGSTLRLVMYLALGLIGLPLGAELLVENATIIAKTFDVTDTIIGLTLVAVGTSLPELATTIMAAVRRQADVALGNVIGSNMFNLLAVIGISSLVDVISVDPTFIEFDLWIMLMSSLLIVPFVFFKLDISRVWGIVLFAVYVVYLSIIFA
ncbi:MAG: calcium/sodium antiporter [Aestuariivita sp.]|nr:calcium/sodium antiporter [Aestuariivita sp.]